MPELRQATDPKAMLSKIEDLGRKGVVGRLLKQARRASKSGVDEDAIKGAARKGLNAHLDAVTGLPPIYRGYFRLYRKLGQVARNLNVYEPLQRLAADKIADTIADGNGGTALAQMKRAKISPRKADSILLRLLDNPVSEHGSRIREREFRSIYRGGHLFRLYKNDHYLKYARTLAMFCRDDSPKVIRDAVLKCIETARSPEVAAELFGLSKLSLKAVKAFATEALRCRIEGAISFYGVGFHLDRDTILKVLSRAEAKATKEP